MRSSEWKDVVPAVFGENTDLIKLRLLDDKRMFELGLRIVFEFQRDVVRYWEIICGQFCSFVIRELANPKCKARFPAIRQVSVLHRWPNVVLTGARKRVRLS
ncbi:hypothetical protein SAMN05518865_1249 [Duganella sp. CF458]|nr:hypothetical protein SAMN05518865_1249 [Duganella sp. CF458]